ncbi:MULTISPECIES: hypothetical protein [Streptomyces]|uniref:Uncharacterized protein n=1 Tax=Streptomyces noursei TaxID=1971 RepID=A0A059W814_STRNR|nr:hypothetical protein [Streptomyces noursei]AKA05623.1 hypothetical protein SAZ_26725 [Streptomyces noursei ZPM]AIA05473.1 hypothetical protein DC74_5003 [Streptomyces noursei]EOT03063.1 hypothetical protein K530_15550 [Streptomyces noursei CCRC 11814]EXU85673.1 hypothetical protein P354_07290 [Streptomyces noursei PD-1]MCE4943171.1 hypothetical protein [Streptomyces noursei]
MTSHDASGKGIHIGSVQGAFAIGDHNTVTHNAGGQGAPAVDPAHEELLRAVRTLREDLARAVETPEVQALTTELADTEEEITGTGAAAPGRLARLRGALSDAGAVVGLLASGAAVVQAVAALVGG